MFLAILQHTPGRVWVLLAVLIALGIVQSRPRAMSVARVTILPLVLIALSLSGVFSAFGHFPIAIGGWAAGVGAALVFARNAIAVRGASFSPSTGLIHVPGSWLPLVLILCLFAIKYFAGVNLAMHPAMATDPIFAGLCSLGYGAFSGMFLARALSLRSLATQPQSMSAA
jgi:hypothetical protein